MSRLFSEGFGRPRLPFVFLAVCAIPVLVAGCSPRLAEHVDTPLLLNEHGAEWIKLETEVHLFRRDAVMSETIFQRRFHTDAVMDSMRFALRAMNECMVMLDGRYLEMRCGANEGWKRTCAALVSPLAAGDHELLIRVQNDVGPPALLLYSDDLEIDTDVSWKSSADGHRWTSAWPVTWTRPAPLSLNFRTPGQALGAVWIWLVPIFAITFLGVLAWGRLPIPKGWTPPTIRYVRWGVRALWLGLILNNVAKVPFIGFDAPEHLDYIRFIAENGSLPLATDGWQMFQPPLYYMISAVLYLLLHDNSTTLIMGLRLIPFACGLAQIEIAYQAARRVFPEREDLQSVALVVAGLMPVSIYTSHFVGNEPMAGALTSLTILAMIVLLTGPRVPRGYGVYLRIGAVWGMAILTKVTAALLLPLVVMSVLHQSRMSGERWKLRILKLGVVTTTSFAVSGWYYIRNWVELGAPYVTGWDSSRGIVWWQDPGYRTISQFVSFGEVFTHPIYASVHGVWDGLYSTLWLDGFLSSVAVFEHRPPWNYDFMLAGTLLAAVPAVLMVLGAATVWSQRFEETRSALLLALAAVAVYIGALLAFFFHVPFYAVPKASYTLGLLPSYGLLAAAGAAQLGRFKLVRPFLAAGIACWAAAVYVAYFVW